MTRLSCSETIVASPETVFAHMTEIEAFPERDPEVIRVEFLGAQRQGPGTRFRQYRRDRRGLEQAFELELVEYIPHVHARFVTDSHGTIWDTVYSIRPNEDGDRYRGGTDVTMTMHARAHRLLPRLINPIMRPVFRRGIRSYLTDLKQRLESES